MKNTASNVIDINDFPTVKKIEVLRTNDYWKHALNLSLVLVKYNDVKEFNGEKLLVIRGSFKESEVDPNFFESNNLVAQFRPDVEGVWLAMKFLNGLL